MIESHTTRVGPQRWILVVLGIAGIVGVASARRTVPCADEFAVAAPAFPPPRRTDPEKAMWWEFAALPGIGEITARNIVAYREHRQRAAPGTLAFAGAEDLRKVRGLGPVKARRMAPYLTFAGSASSATKRATVPITKRNAGKSSQAGP